MDADSANFDNHSVAIVLGLWDIANNLDEKVSMMVDGLEDYISWIKGIPVLQRVQSRTR